MLTVMVKELRVGEMETQDPGNEQIVLESDKPQIYCGGCLIAMIKLSSGVHQCPKCKTINK
jgi:hypothetical protein